jgi:hypothetical protein
MFVFVTTSGIAYEGEELTGAYSTLENALASFSKEQIYDWVEDGTGYGWEAEDSTFPAMYYYRIQKVKLDV